MNAEQYVQAGRLEEALASLQDAVRTAPADPKLRTFLFQLQCVLGQWERAETQLKVLGNMNPETLMLSRIFEPVVLCEALRAEVFAGKRTPLLFGEPAEWMGRLAQANILVAQGEFAAGAELRQQAFEAAPASAGTIDGQPFAWIADADSRLGPMLEAIVEGKYYWIPFCRIQKIQSEAPSDLRDLVWLPVQFTWINGGTAAGHIPVRYPGTEHCPDNAVRLARKTDWQEKTGDTFLGLGQRVMATDVEEYPLLGSRCLEFTTAP